MTSWKWAIGATATVIVCIAAAVLWRFMRRSVVSEFISEDDLKTFEGWMRYQGIDVADLDPAELATWRGTFADVTARAAATPKVGLMKLRSIPGEHRWAVAIRDGAYLWLTLWVRRSPKGEFFVMIPRGEKGWDPHTSYHLNGTVHGKSHGQKIGQPTKRQPLIGVFKGTEHLGGYAGHGKAPGAICDPAAFCGVVEVPAGVLGPRDGGVTVDLVEPGVEPIEFGFKRIVKRQIFRDVIPWVVITIGRHD
jgi:hypothetical protein